MGYSPWVGKIQTRLSDFRTKVLVFFHSQANALVVLIPVLPPGTLTQIPLEKQCGSIFALLVESPLFAEAPRWRVMAQPRRKM